MKIRQSFVADARLKTEGHGFLYISAFTKRMLEATVIFVMSVCLSVKKNWTRAERMVVFDVKVGDVL
jgi:hypothetical protein